MPKFRTRTHTVEATQWFPGIAVPGVIEKDRAIGSFYAHAYIELHNYGPHAVNPGDWITHEDGMIKVISDQVFKHRFEAVFDIEPIDISDVPEPQSIERIETAVIRKKKS